MLAIGELTPAEAAAHPQRNLLYRCLGHEPSVVVWTAERQLMVGDALVLCSDGLTAHLSGEEIAAIVHRRGDAAALAATLIAEANARGGSDNVSAVVLLAEEEG